jgi:uncharacterized membrane protein
MPDKLNGDGKYKFNIKKEVNIDVPIEKAYGFYTNMNQLPNHLSELLNVQFTPDGKRSHWAIKGPLGLYLSWEAETIRNLPNREIAWKSIPQSTISNQGAVKFYENGAGKSKIVVEINYTPPLGEIGEKIAEWFGANPEDKLSRSLEEIKATLESKTTQTASKSPQSETVQKLHGIEEDF